MTKIESSSSTMQSKQSRLPRVTSQGDQLEYTALRSEILKRIELRHQIIQSVMVFAGIIFGLGLNNPSVAFIFPSLVALFALSWVHSDYRIRDMANYIRENIEPTFETPGWETVLQGRRNITTNRRWRLIFFSHGGLFLVIQLISIFIGITKYNHSLAETVLLVVSFFSVIYVIYIVSRAPSQSDALSLFQK